MGSWQRVNPGQKCMCTRSAECHLVSVQGVKSCYKKRKYWCVLNEKRCQFLFLMRVVCNIWLNYALICFKNVMLWTIY